MSRHTKALGAAMLAWLVGAMSACGGSSQTAIGANATGQDGGASDVGAGVPEASTSEDGSSDGQASGDAGSAADTSDGSPCATAEMLCGAACIAGANDPNNCGRCGHSCLGSTCSEGACAAVVLSAPQGKLGALLAEDGNVYWAASLPSGPVIRRTGRDAAAGFETTLSKTQYLANTIELRSSTLYYGDGPGISMLPMTGGAPTSILPVPELTFDLDPDATHAFITTGGTVYDCKLDGSTRPCTTYDSDLDSTAMGSIQALGDLVFWPNHITNRIRRLTRSTGVVDDFAADEYVANYLRTDGTDLYWYALHGTTDFIVRSPLAVGAISELAPVPEGYAQDMAVGHGIVAYLVDKNVMVLPSTGGQPVLIAKSDAPLKVAVDDVAVYWTDSDGLIRKVARP